MSLKDKFKTEAAFYFQHALGCHEDDRASSVIQYVEESWEMIERIIADPKRAACCCLSSFERCFLNDVLDPVEN